jgi:hypothetical protein
MHRALLIQEVLDTILYRLGIRDLQSLACTCHAFTEPALDAAWAEPSAWDLAHLKPKGTWEVKDTVLPYRLKRDLVSSVAIVVRCVY